MADPIEQLLNEVGHALADVLSALKARGAEEAAALADLVAAIEKRKDTDLSGVVKALQALREAKPPQVTVDVDMNPVADAIRALPAILAQHTPQPAPLPPAAPATWEVRIPGSHGAPDRVMLITKK